MAWLLELSASRPDRPAGRLASRWSAHDANGVLVSGRFALGHALINRESLEEIAQEMAHPRRAGTPSMVVTPNADHVVTLEKNRELREAYSKAAVVTPDGMPVVWASRWLGTPVKERVTGSDLMPRLCEIAAQRGLKSFCLAERQALPSAPRTISRMPTRD